MKKILIPVLLLGSLSLSGQIRNDEVFELPEMEISDLRNDIRIPDVDGFHVLKCDFHTHTIFSDGRVWPTMRVDEAWKDGLDAIAITDHIEVRPWKPFVSGGDLNSSFDIAKQRADQIGFIVIKGIEITRAKPLGHINARTAGRRERGLPSGRLHHVEPSGLARRPMHDVRRARAADQGG